MLENIREMKAFPATPRLRQMDVGDLFPAIESKAGRHLPTWNGELYLELHRGTYTTQSRTKRAIAKASSGFMTPNFWRRWLRCSILIMSIRRRPCATPGSWSASTSSTTSSPEAVLARCMWRHKNNMPRSSRRPGVQDAALSAIADRLGDPSASESTQSLLIVNPTSFVRDDLAFWPGLADGRSLQRADGAQLPIQPTADGPGSPGVLPPFSVTPLTEAAGAGPYQMASWRNPQAGEHVFARGTERAGDITRIYDKVNGRDVLPQDAIANQFQAFEDRPLQWDAWDVDIFFEDKMWKSDPASSVNVIEAGPLRATLEVRRRILHSDYVQRISLHYNSPRLDFDTTIDWRERHILLKVAFPVDVLSNVATYDIQWGNVQRATHRNTSWDWAL